MTTATKMATVPRPRSKRLDLSVPSGQLGHFLRHWFDTHEMTQVDLAKELGIQPRTIRKWMEGVAAPSLNDLERLAGELGYADWAALAVAVARFCKR